MRHAGSEPSRGVRPLAADPAVALAADAASTRIDEHAPCARLSLVDGAVARVNSVAVRLLGRESAALLGQPFGVCLTRDSVLLWESHFLPLLMVRGSLDGALLSGLTGGGNEFPMLVAASSRVEDGRVTMEIALLAVRHRVAYEQALEAARDAAEAARAEVAAAHAALAASVEREREVADQLRQAQKLEAVGQLAGGIAHDFNNLLTVVTGHAEVAMIQLSTLPVVVRQGVATELTELQRTVERAAAVVRQLLAFSRQQVLSPTTLDLAEVVRGAEPLLRPTLGAATAWRVEVHPGVGQVVADRGQLEQVLLNLVLNARDAIAETGRAGAVTVRIAPWTDTSTGHETPTHWARVTVTDTGAGMNAETLAKACDPFFTTKDIGQGSGLGLAMVYGIVHQSAGRVSLASTPGVGTTVTIDLPTTPVRDAVAMTPRAERDTRHAVDTEASLESTGSPQPSCVLLVEDEPALRRLAERMLERAGYSVLACEDGDAAWQVWERERARILAVISDVRMPGRDGHALHRALRRETRALPVVLMSGYADRPVDDLGERDAFLEKPFSSAQLLQALAKLGMTQ